MSKHTYDRLTFPSGRTVKRIKQDAKALAKKDKIPLHKALDLLAAKNGLDTGWHKALSELKKIYPSLSSKAESIPPSKHSALADELGLTDEELDELSWEAEENQSNEGLVYSYIIQFCEDSPKELLMKISGLQPDNSIEVSANAFDEPDTMHLPQEDFIDPENDIRLLTDIARNGKQQPDGSYLMNTSKLKKLANKSATGLGQQLTRLKHTRLSFEGLPPKE